MKVLHQSQFFTSYQCDKQRCFFIEFPHKTIQLGFCQFLAFRQQVKEIDLDSHFNGQNPHGLEMLMLCNRQHFFVLNTLECIDLKEFITGSFAMLELNSLLTNSV
ncbi:hypothetical protein ACWBC2_03545 [Salegentibacter agarivorans]